LKSGTSSNIDYCEFDAEYNSGVTGSLIYVESDALNMTGSVIKHFDKTSTPTLSWNNVEGENLAVTMNLNACTFEENISDEGGVFKYLYASKYTLNIQNCIFNNNESTGMGGAISTYKGLSLSGCKFNGNKATSGGAICMSLDVDVDSNPATHTAWEKNEVVANNATFTSDSVTNEGGAVFIKSGKFKANGATFKKNHAGGYDGHSGGAITIGSHRFNGTESSDATYNYASSAWATLDNCTFEENTGTERGGAINQYCGVSYIHNCTFKNNLAGLRGGAFYGEAWGFSFQNNNRYIHNKIRGEAFGTQIFCSIFGWMFANNLYVKGNDEIADDSDSNNAPVSMSSRIILTNSTIIANLKDATGIGCLSYENC
jgi:predicted outer membrane repeat protein